MLNLEDVTAILNEHAENLGDELMAELGVKLLEHDVPAPDVEAIKAELEAERSARAEDKARYVETINKFIYKGEAPDTETETEATDEAAVEEVEDPYEVLYGGNE